MSEPKVSMIGVSGTGFVSTAIKSFDQVDNGCGVSVSHVAWKFYFPSLTLVYESHFKGGVQITPWHHVHRAMADGKINRIVEWDMEATAFQIQQLWNECEKVHKDGYDVKRILAYYVMLRRRNRKGESMPDCHDPKRFTCNELLVHTGRQIFDWWKLLDFTYTPNRLTKFMNREKPFARVS